MQRFCVRLILGLMLAAAIILETGVPDLSAADKKAADAIDAMVFTKHYAENGAEFDKMYKGKTVTIEGIVSGSAVKDYTGKSSFLMIGGYTKPGGRFSHNVRCVESGPDFEGIRIGHKVRIQGTVQGHSETSTAAELRDCKVVKVLASDYPPSKAVRAEVKKLQGKWKVISGEANGQKLEPKKKAGFYDAISFEGYTVYLHQGDQLFSFGLVAYPEKKPNALDLVGGKGMLPCIYTLEGDRLRLALPPPAKDGTFSRPTSFDTTKIQSLVLNAERQK